MADSTTPILGLLLQETPSHINDWINQFNTNVLLPAEIAVAGVVEQFVRGGDSIFIDTPALRAKIVKVIEFGTAYGTFGLDGYILPAFNTPHVYVLNNTVTYPGARVFFGSRPGFGASVQLRSGFQAVYYDQFQIPHLL